MTKIALALTTAMMAVSPAYADGCDGRLTHQNGYLAIREGHEAICMIDRCDELKVLSACSIGGRCTVRGITDLCKNGVECWNITHVTSARPSITP
jgi:hypothetical protein